MMNTQEIQGHWNDIRGKVKEKWGQLTNDDLLMMEGNVDQVVGRIQQKTGEARETIENFLNDLVPSESTIRHAAEHAAEYAQHAAESVREGYQHVSDQAREGYRQAEHVFREHPTQSVGAIFGFGLIAGVIVGLLLNSD